MRENYTLTRLYVEADLSEGETVELSKEQAHYLGNVLRKGEGDAVRLFNGNDGEWRAEIASVSKRAATLTVKECLRDLMACPDVTLCFAPIRKHRTTFIIEKATELGVRTLQPVITAHTQFPKFNIEKARLQAIEAAEQTERLDVPNINPVLGLDRLLSDWDEELELIFADEAGDADNVMDRLPQTYAHTPPRGAIIVGPEGGFTPQERELLHSQDFVRPVNLGPRILRADTAALSLLTLWQSICGDWS